jgi:predicted RNA-binding protein with PUA-like domain
MGRGLIVKKHWLFKTEPHVFSIENLENATDKTTRWDGVRNYQARNLLRDEIKVGDEVFVYHSQCKVPGIVGLAKVVKASYPDPAQFNPESDYYDPKANADSPRWFCVDIQHQKTFAKVIPLQELKQNPDLHDMVLLKQGRLSVQPVTAEQAAVIKRDYSMK